MSSIPSLSSSSSSSVLFLSSSSPSPSILPTLAQLATPYYIHFLAIFLNFLICNYLKNSAQFFYKILSVMRKLNSFCSATLSYLHIYNFIQNSEFYITIFFTLIRQKYSHVGVPYLVLFLFFWLLMFYIFYLIYQIKLCFINLFIVFVFSILICVSQIVNIFLLKYFFNCAAIYVGIFVTRLVCLLNLAPYS